MDVVDVPDERLDEDTVTVEIEAVGMELVDVLLSAELVDAELDEVDTRLEKERDAVDEMLVLVEDETTELEDTDTGIESVPGVYLVRS